MSNRFRPLSGYLISKFIKAAGVTAGRVFPSPLGVSYFQMGLGLNFLIGSYIVSVPSRGILFPNTNMKLLLIDTRPVSVPSRGILFPNKTFTCG